MLGHCTAFTMYSSLRNGFHWYYSFDAGFLGNSVNAMFSARERNEYKRFSLLTLISFFRISSFEIPKADHPLSEELVGTYDNFSVSDAIKARSSLVSDWIYSVGVSDRESESVASE